MAQYYAGQLTMLEKEHRAHSSSYHQDLHQCQCTVLQETSLIHLFRCLTINFEKIMQFVLLQVTCEDIPGDGTEVKLQLEVQTIRGRKVKVIEQDSQTFSVKSLVPGSKYEIK